MDETKIKNLEQFLVGKNLHSVYTHCFNCHLFGVNLPNNDRCGNCGSYETVKYFDLKTIQNLLIEMKKKEKRGGKRKGSGRPKKEATKVMRVPMSLVAHVVGLIKKP